MKSLNKLNKKAAIELSVSSIVVIVIAMTMLILGLVLVRTIFSGAQENVKEINDEVKNQIGKLFEEEGGKTMVYLSGHKAEIKQGKDWGVAFAIKNTETGTTESSEFSYVVSADDLTFDCKGLTKAEAESWIKARKSGSMTISPGQTGYTIISFQILKMLLFV